MNSLTNLNFGLIGKSLSHSFSKNYFTKKFEQLNLSYTYKNFEIDDITLFPKLLIENEPLNGLNVTIPFKESILPYLNALSEPAKAIGAVNTIVINNTGLIGYNTDFIGFKKSIQPFLASNHNKAIIIGNGGVSKAIQYALQLLGIDYLVFARQPRNNAELQLKELTPLAVKHFPFIIQTTPVGMYNHTDDLIFPYEALNDTHFCFDVIYNPEETLFLKKSKQQGALIVNGYDMLVHQAEEAYNIWLANK